MRTLLKRKTIFAVLLCVLATAAVTLTLAWWRTSTTKPLTPPAAQSLQLYWFIPDGLRAEESTMRVYEWAREGELPNIKWMMEHGSYGYSVPVFPGHTTSNTATLVTGASPKVHGITDIAIRVPGRPVASPAYNGFSSLAKKVPSIWTTLEETGRKVALLSVPGSTPPEISNGIVIRGRWGGWGTEFPAVIFQSEDMRKELETEGTIPTAPGGTSPLTVFVKPREPRGWKIPLPKTPGEEREVEMKNFGVTLYGYAYGDRVLLSLDKRSVWADIAAGEWSDWKTLNLEGASRPVDARARLIKSGRDGFRLRLLYDVLNEYSVTPSALALATSSPLRRMVDFPDNYPPQLVHFAEDKKVFLEEAQQSFAWHKSMVGFLAGQSDIVLHDIYTPNQMLTSRWWLPFVDPKSARYGEAGGEHRAQLLTEVKDMYKQVDAILGEAIRAAGPGTYIVMSSDHGAIPLDFEVLVNNWLEKKGFLKFKPVLVGHDPQIDWEKSRAVFLQMTQVFVNRKGLGGDFEKGTSPEDLRLVEDVRLALEELRSADGAAPFGPIREGAGAREGNLVVSFQPGFSGIERVTKDREIFKTTLMGGYKQGLLSTEEGMLTPFMIVGPGVKKNFALPRKIQHQDQYPTIMKLLGVPSPAFVEGHAIEELFEGGLKNGEAR